MRMAKFLGLIHFDGGPISNDSIGTHYPGDTFLIFPRPDSSCPYPWMDEKTESSDTCFFRTEELEFLPEKELDLNDYL